MSAFIWLLALPYFFGAYCYQGQYSVEGTRIRELVDPRGAGASQKIALLQQQGFTCLVQSGNIVVCDHVVHPGLITERLQRKLREMPRVCAQFGELRQEPGSTSDSSVYESWDYPQELTFGGKHLNRFPLYRVWSGEGPVDRIDDPQGEWHLVVSGTNLIWPFEVAEQSGKRQYLHRVQVQLDQSVRNP